MYAMLIVLAVVAGLVCLAIISCNREKVRERKDERREERSQKTATFTVAEIIDGATIEVADGRFKRTKRINLQGIEIPVEVAQEAKENLIRLTSGGAIRVEWIHHGLFSSTGEPVEESTYDAPGPITGLVFGAGNRCANLEQLRAGLARCNSEASEIMRAEERWARTHKKGYWSDTVIVSIDQLPPLTDDESDSFKAELQFGKWMKTHCETCKECTYTPVRGGFPEWEAKCDEALSRLKEIRK